MINKKTNRYSSDTILRPASKADAEGIFRVLASAFRLEEGTDSWRHRRNIAYDRTERSLVLERAGKVIAALVISPHWLRIGTTKVLKGDIGEVGVLQEMQGQGFGTQLMQGCVEYLRGNGYHLSRLGGLNRFYGSFGYVPFPRRYYEFLLTEARAGASTITPERYLELTPEQEQCVRLYTPHRDWQRRDELYEHFNQNRSGSLVRGRQSTQPPVSQPDPESLNLVYEENGQVYGYLFASQHPEDHSPFEAKIRIGDVAFQMDKPEAFKALMHYVLRAAAQRGVQRVTARLPFDPLIQKLLTEAAAPSSLHELQSAPASNMMLVVDLPGLLQAIAPELTRRRAVASPCPPFSLHLQVGKHDAVLRVDSSSVEPVNEEKTDARVSCDQMAFLRWILGLNGFDEWQVGVIHDLNTEQKQILATLFRREPCASGPWG
jgi:predicted N-acetyltransferase YhbS